MSIESEEKLTVCKDDSFSSIVASKTERNGEKEKVEGGANPNLQQLLTRILQEVEENRPKNKIYFIVDFLCKNYPEHLPGFAGIWSGDAHLEKEKRYVLHFFRHQKLPSEIATHFISAGFDTLETLCTLTAESLDDIERFNDIRWLPGHKVRLQQAFSDIASRVRTFREEMNSLIAAARQAQYTTTEYPSVSFPSNSVSQYYSLPQTQRRNETMYDSLGKRVISTSVIAPPRAIESYNTSGTNRLVYCNPPSNVSKLLYQ